jgi:hypothetical protein
LTKCCPTKDVDPQALLACCLSAKIQKRLIPGHDIFWVAK